MKKSCYILAFIAMLSLSGCNKEKEPEILFSVNGYDLVRQLTLEEQTALFEEAQQHAIKELTEINGTYISNGTFDLVDDGIFVSSKEIYYDDIANPDLLIMLNYYQYTDGAQSKLYWDTGNSEYVCQDLGDKPHLRHEKMDRTSKDFKEATIKSRVFNQLNYISAQGDKTISKTYEATNGYYVSYYKSERKSEKMNKQVVYDVIDFDIAIISKDKHLLEYSLGMESKYNAIESAMTLEAYGGNPENYSEIYDKFTYSSKRTTKSVKELNEQYGVN